MGYCNKHDAYNGNGHCIHCDNEPTGEGGVMDTCPECNSAREFPYPVAAGIRGDGTGWRFVCGTIYLEEQRRITVRGQACKAIARVTAERDAAIVEAQQAANDRAIMKAQLDRAEAERDRLREALDFYACVDHYAGGCADDVVSADRGAKARAALNREGEG